MTAPLLILLSGTAQSHDFLSTEPLFSGIESFSNRCATLLRQSTFDSRPCGESLRSGGFWPAQSGTGRWHSTGERRAPDWRSPWKLADRRTGKTTAGERGKRVAAGHKELCNPGHADRMRPPTGELLALRVDSIQSREERWVIADLLGKAGHIRTVPIPAMGEIWGREMDGGQRNRRRCTLPIN